ncbi:hypothetical protein C0431_13160 [bacterium]|nr:hypothetical protein [bacterium]
MSWAKRAAQAVGGRMKRMPGEAIEGLKEPGLIKQADGRNLDNLFTNRRLTSRAKYGVAAGGVGYGVYQFDDADSKAIEQRAEMTNEIQSIAGTRADQMNYQAYSGRTIRGARNDQESLVFAMHKLRHSGYLGG